MSTPTWDVRSEEGFMACYRATLAEVYRYAAMLCGSDRGAAEDIVQDVYLTALTKARSGGLHELNVGYLMVATRHRHLDRLRSEQRAQRRLELVASAPPVDAPTRSLPPQLSDLPERDRVALVLRYVDDLSVAHVGNELGISTHAAESLLARAARRLRQQEARDA
jgi:RNA polymerase sigma factor (sigma-70 family)